MIEIRHLRYFVAVAEELNFSRAAERLHMAQPPLSAAIRRLEEELGFELLTRTTRDVRLTEAGTAFLAGARSTLEELDRTVAVTRRAAAGELGRVRIGFSWSARFVTLPVIGGLFRDRHPDVTVLTEEMWNSRMPAALRGGAIDLAIAICPEVSDRLAYETIRVEPLVIVTGSGHRLAGAEEVSLPELGDDDFLVFPRELAPGFYDRLVGACRRAGFEPRVRSESFHTNWELGLQGDPGSVALVPESVTAAAGDDIASIRLREVEEIETAVVWDEGSESPASRSFRSSARDAFTPAGPAAGGR